MEASFVVPGPLDVAGTLSRLHLWGEDPANRFATVCFVAHHDGTTPGRLPDDEVMERLTTLRGFGPFPAMTEPAGRRAAAEGGA